MGKDWRRSAHQGLTQLNRERHMKLKLVQMWICQGCLDGDGDECHTPGCAMYLHSVDLPIAPELYEVLKEVNEMIPGEG